MKSSENNKMLSKDLLNSVEERLIQNLAERIISNDEFINRVAEKMIEIPKQECEFYTSKEICAIYKISLATLERMIRSGLKCESQGAKTKRLFTKKDFENFKNKNR